MPRPAISCHDYGHLPDGRTVHQYTLDNGAGLRLSAINYGGIVTALEFPDAQSRSANVVLGFSALHDYVERNPHFGIIVGRYANRIAGARLELGGRSYALDANDGPHCLHGGAQGFGRRLWEAEIEGQDLLLHLDSADGDQGFPGRLQVQVRYSLGDDMSWRIDYEARCERATVVNLSHHDYFNLAGSGTALQHQLQIHASHYTEADARRIPLAIAPVQGTPFDFLQARTVAERMGEPHPQLLRSHGYDHNWLLDGPLDAEGLRPVARLSEPVSGRVMEIRSSEPALQFYSGNFLDGSLLGSGGQHYQRGDGLCLETQHSPDSPAHPNWPSTVLRPGEVYRSCTVHRFAHLSGREQ